MEDLLLTPERRQKAAEVQALRRSRSGNRVLTDPAQVKFRWGAQRELDASNQLQALQTSGRPDAQLEATLYDRIAAGRAAQGKFAEAAAICKGEAVRAEYEAKAQALHEPGRRCACPAKQQQRQAGNAKAVETATQIPAETIWTGTELITLMRCAACERYSVLERHQD